MVNKEELQFPIMPDPNGGDEFIKAYVNERKALSSAQDLSEFVNRWKSVFILCKENKQTEKQLSVIESLIDGTFDADLAWSCLHNECEHTLCAGLTILLPSSLYYTNLCAKEFEVPGDVAFIQLYQLNHLW